MYTLARGMKIQIEIRIQLGQPPFHGQRLKHKDTAQSGQQRGGSSHCNNLSNSAKSTKSLRPTSKQIGHGNGGSSIVSRLVSNDDERNPSCTTIERGFWGQTRLDATFVNQLTDKMETDGLSAPSNHTRHPLLGVPKQTTTKHRQFI